MMTAAVAWTKMTPGARCRATLLLQSNPEYSRGLQNPTHIDPAAALFVNAATWPDRIKATGSGFIDDGDDAVHVGAAAALNQGLSDLRKHKYWHFVDNPVPLGPGHPPPAVNAVERVALFANTINNRHTPIPLKAYDLAWLIHLVGDLHQPLHTTSQFGPAFAHGSDAGGNNIAVVFTGYQELHGFWDGTPGDQRDNMHVLADSVGAASHLPSPPVAAANVTNPQKWANESYQLALSRAFIAPIVLQSAGPFTLTSTYASGARTVGRDQVALGGVRLAHLLNAILTWPAPGCP